MQLEGRSYHDTGLGSLEWMCFRVPSPVSALGSHSVGNSAILTARNHPG